MTEIEVNLTMQLLHGKVFYTWGQVCVAVCHGICKPCMEFLDLSKTLMWTVIIVRYNRLAANRQV